MPNLKVLLAYEERYLSYAQVFGAAVRMAEPSSEVRVVGTGKNLGAEVSSFGPHLVISSRPTDVFPDVEAWFTLSPESDEPSEFRLGGRHWICVNPDLGSLGRVVDAVSGLVRDGRDPAVP